MNDAVHKRVSQLCLELAEQIMVEYRLGGGTYSKAEYIALVNMMISTSTFVSSMFMKDDLPEEKIRKTVEEISLKAARTGIAAAFGK